jgi:hypothetical protein
MLRGKRVMPAARCRAVAAQEIDVANSDTHSTIILHALVNAVSSVKLCMSNILATAGSSWIAAARYIGRHTGKGQQVTEVITIQLKSRVPPQHSVTSE